MINSFFVNLSKAFILMVRHNHFEHKGSSVNAVRVRPHELLDSHCLSQNKTMTLEKHIYFTFIIRPARTDMTKDAVCVKYLSE